MDQEDEFEELTIGSYIPIEDYPEQIKPKEWRSIVDNTKLECMGIVTDYYPGSEYFVHQGLFYNLDIVDVDDKHFNPNNYGFNSTPFLRLKRNSEVVFKLKILSSTYEIIYFDPVGKKIYVRMTIKESNEFGFGDVHVSKIFLVDFSTNVTPVFELCVVLPTLTREYYPITAIGTYKGMLLVRRSGALIWAHSQLHQNNSKPPSLPQDNTPVRSCIALRGEYLFVYRQDYKLIPLKETWQLSKYSLSTGKYVADLDVRSACEQKYMNLGFQAIYPFSSFAIVRTVTDEKHRCKLLATNAAFTRVTSKIDSYFYFNSEATVVSDKDILLTFFRNPRNCKQAILRLWSVVRGLIVYVEFCIPELYGGHPVLCGDLRTLGQKRYELLVKARPGNIVRKYRINLGK